MNLVEQAIRAALTKGNAEDQAFRNRIYGSASSALERSIAARPLGEEEIQLRRLNLVATIKHIESEFAIAVESESPADAQRQVSENVYPNEQVTQPHEAMADQQVEPSAAVVEIPDRRQLRPVKLKKALRSYKSRPWLTYALNGGFLVALIFGGFWLYQQGKQMYVAATTAKSSTQKPALSENKDKNGNDPVDWIQVFSASDTDLLSAAPGAKAEITSREGSNFVVMSGDSTNEVVVKIGAGLMQTFAGKRVLFNIKARSINGTVLDTGAYCAFGKDTKCERKRFKIGPQSAEFMFAVSVAASANGDGALHIAPDLTGGNGSIEVETIRATVVDLKAG